LSSVNSSRRQHKSHHPETRYVSSPATYENSTSWNDATRAVQAARDTMTALFSMVDLKGNTFFDGPAGRIEAILKEGSDSKAAAIVCHPHPLFGGTMHNKVVFRISRAFEAMGFSVLRFNFRGVGRSEGKHDNGNGEQDDVKAAIAFMLERTPEAELWIAGFSFGSAAMLRAACGNPAAHALIAAGTPVSRYSLEDLKLNLCSQPKLFVQGELDEYGPVAELERIMDRAPQPAQLRVIAGADHFFEGHLPELSAAVSEFVTATRVRAVEKSV